ncbi:MAG: helix-turn-helix transcriptional regulator [Oscillospiraceae bacterium]|nr:helix-turn-helix transcriptional regulator [Oscillospiraceae bacterium]
MRINDLLEQKNMTKYRLAKSSGVSQTTVIDICSGKVRVEKCTGDTLYKLAKALDVPMETLVEAAVSFSSDNERKRDKEYRPAFDTFKSNVCHAVKDMGDLDFLLETLETNQIRKLHQKKWYPESLYLLAMIDYLSRENDVPACAEYNDLRATRLLDPVFPSSVIAMSVFAGSDQPKIDSYEQSIPEFKRFNIVEGDVRNVF